MLVRNDLFLKFLKYSFVGFFSTLIYFLSVYILVELLLMEPIMGSAFSFLIMTVFSFFLNKKYTFKSDFSNQKLVRFFIVSGIGFMLNFVIMYSIVSLLSYHYFLGELATILVIPLVNFLLNNYWTFK
ncbi:GtrA family protein [Peribacillus acanthi]|uniref:GtrA family protein n=1 Tax=Peribacillus acanthi TaxID=2171554 RepID=UPI000D3E1A8D